MLAIKWKEDRARTLLARIKRVKAIQNDVIQSPEWMAQTGTPTRYRRAYALQLKCQKQLGALAAISLMEVRNGT